jgi:hypothetical protein
MGAWVATSAASALAGTGAGRALAGAGSSPAGAAVAELAGSSLVAFRDVWDGLEDAARLVGGAGAEATRTLMHARYGAASDAVADAGIAILGDCGEVALNVRQMGLKGVLRKTAAEAAAVALGVAGPRQPLLLERGGNGGGGGGGDGGGCCEDAEQQQQKECGKGEK